MHKWISYQCRIGKESTYSAKFSHRMLECRDRYGGQPLDDAVRKRNIDIVQLLVTSRQAMLSQAVKYARQLVNAAASNDVVLLDVLLKAGLSPNCCGEDHRTALHMCVPNSCYAAAEMLLAHPDTHVGPLDRLGHTPLWDAISCGDFKLAKLLYQHGAPLQQKCAAQVCQRAADNDCAFLECMLNLNLPVNMRVRTVHTRKYPCNVQGPLL